VYEDLEPLIADRTAKLDKVQELAKGLSGQDLIAMKDQATRFLEAYDKLI
jgi:hypothetical protein